MACFVAPAATAAVITTVRKKVPPQYHIDWLLMMLWGGFIVLIIDHIANNEVVPYFPFFTAGWSKIWPEILQVGVPMTLAVTDVWLVMLIVSAVNSKKSAQHHSAK